MTMADAAERFKALTNFTRSIMREDIDYGTVPGTSKPTLLKPGAEKLTTFFGLAPMVLETSPQARFLIPMALSLSFGALFVTVVVLVMVPPLYIIVERMKLNRVVRSAATSSEQRQTALQEEVALG